MTLTKSYVQHQYANLGDYTRKTLDQLDDPGLVERTVLYNNLLTISTNSNKVMSDTATIAQTIVNILDSQAWLDFVDVDGQRKACESFSKFLEKNRFDITLAEFAIKEKRNDMHGRFIEARDGPLLSRAQASAIAAAKATAARINPSGAAVPRPEKSKRVRRLKSDEYRLRLEREAQTDKRCAFLLDELNKRNTTITAIAITLGWSRPRLTKEAQYVINNTVPQAKPIIKTLGLSPEIFCKIALTHLTNNPELIDHYRHLLESNETL